MSASTLHLQYSSPEIASRSFCFQLCYGLFCFQLPVFAIFTVSDVDVTQAVMAWLLEKRTGGSGRWAGLQGLVQWVQPLPLLQEQHLALLQECLQCDRAGPVCRAALRLRCLPPQPLVPQSVCGRASARPDTSAGAWQWNRQEGVKQEASGNRQQTADSEVTDSRQQTADSESARKCSSKEHSKSEHEELVIPTFKSYAKAVT